ncbi:histidine phosphatase family protein [Deinococcus caeni]|uniref:Histidine phosphatase family protein n=1 Tax=Deinococcus caeni TaxID=569127 RepID=A0ABP9UFP6_9DEIO
MHLVLIRHAQSLNNVLYAQTGGKEGRHPDPPLSDVGFEQARLLGEGANRIPHLGSLTHLYSSLTTRAAQTAAPLATALALPVQGTDALQEIGGLYLGQLTGPRTPTAGQTRQTLQRICPELRWPAHLDGRSAWDGGFEENDEQVYAARARTVLHDLQTRHTVTDRVGLIRIPFISPTIRNFTGLPAPRPEPVSLLLCGAALRVASARTQRAVQPIQSESV